MKQFITFLMAIFVVINIQACGSKGPKAAQVNDQSDKKEKIMDSKKILIVYYSRSGMNYVSGSIVNLKVGNTKVVAQKIHDLTGADMFEIETVKPYPADYHKTTEVAQEEYQADARPEIKGKVGDMDKYDTIILGYPCWWGTFPMCVATFLEQYDLTGKTILPYCTHEGSGMGSSESHLKRLYPKAKVLDGQAIKGSRVTQSDDIIKKWLQKNNMIK
jgi:flavodoxin/predicted small lipoprotein YifL